MAPGWVTSGGTIPPTGVPPGATVIVAPATVTVVVVVGIAMTTVELDRTNVCDDAPDEGTGFGSAQTVNTRRIFSITSLLHVTAVKVGTGSCVI